MLPDKYGDGTHIGEPRNGYQLVDDAGELKMKRKPDVSGYDADDLTKLTEHRDAHVLERHGHDVTDDALVKRANTGTAPDGNNPGFKPPYSSKFESPDQVKKALANTEPGTAAFNNAPVNYGTKVVYHTLTDGSTYGKGVPRDGSSFLQSTKVRAVYREVSPGNFQLLTMFPDF